MPIKAAVGSRHWIIILLVAITAGAALMVDVALPLPGAKLGGGFFLVLGIVNILFFRQTGRKIFAKAQVSKPLVARLWRRIGENGAQLLFLGIGVILATAGCVLLTAGGWHI